MMDKRYAMIGVDMETDVGSFTPFYEGTKHGTPKLLNLFREKGIKATFFFTGDCARENPEIARLVAGSGNEVGAHSLYHETVGDELFPIPGVKPLLPHEVKPRLLLANQWIEEACGVRPLSFRSPRLWGSTALINALEELGFLTDASYPMYYYRERFSPYHPSREDWTKPGDSVILELPNFADMSMESHDPGLERDRDQWPLFRTEGADFLLKRMDAFIDFCKNMDQPPFICLYIHPWEFWPMEKSYHFGEATVIPDEFITKNCGEGALGQLGQLIVGMQQRGFTFSTAKDLYKVYARKMA